jgi:hypothetical protein
MSAPAIGTSECTLRLTGEERSQLVLFLEQALRDLLIEIHRTEAPDYREHVQRKEAALRRVLDKLRQA